MEVGAVGTMPLAAEVAALRQEMAALQIKALSPAKDGQNPVGLDMYNLFHLH